MMMGKHMMNGLSLLATLLAGTLILIAVALTALFWVPEAYGAETVIVDGYGQDMDSAMEDAKRTAVSTVLGEALSSRSLVENFALVSDRILSSSSGYVSGTEVLETKTFDGLLMLKVRATVEDEVVGHDVDAIRVLSATRGNPRFAVVWDGGVGHDRRSNSLHAEAQRGITRYFTDHGFELVQLPKSELAYGAQDAGAIADLSGFAAGAGAEYAVLLDVRVLEDDPGRVFANATARATLTVIHTGTYRVLAETKARGSGGDEDAEFAALNAAENAGFNAAQEAVTSILNDWTRAGKANGNQLTLTVNGLPGDKVSAFTDAMLGTGSLHQMTLRSGDDRKASFAITLDGSLSDLAEAVETVLDGQDWHWALSDATGSALSYRVLRD